MTVLPFRKPADHPHRGWSQCELEQLVRLYAAHAADGQVAAWDVAATELCDPQFFLLGPQPDGACALSVSRVGRLYVLEDGNGRLLGEDQDLSSITSKASRCLRPRAAAAFIARMLLTLCALRTAIDEKIEPLVPDSVELLVPLAAML